MTRVAHDHLNGNRQVRAQRHEDHVAHILQMHQNDRTSRPVALAAKCVQCRGSIERIRSCPDKSCSLFLLRPFQRDVEPRSAPHIVRATDENEVE